MEMTKLQKELFQELKMQEVPIDWIKSVMLRMKTVKQQQAMMKYLETTRDKTEPLDSLVFKTTKIKNTIKD